MSQFVPIASCPVIGHHRVQFGPVFFIVSHQLFIRIALSTRSRLSCTLHNPLHTLYNRCSYPLIFFVAFAALDQLLRAEIL